VFDIASSTRDTAELLNGIYEDLRNDWLPYAFWPQERGLVQWGAVEIETLFWLTEGEPDRWPVVVVRDTEQIYERLDITATELVLGLIQGPSPSGLILPLSGPEITFSTSPPRAADYRGAEGEATDPALSVNPGYSASTTCCGHSGPGRPRS
jgi:hypothetical protein